LMSLLDGHPDLLVYPDEPAFGKIFRRAQHYRSAKHVAADFLFGTTNPVHLASEAGTGNVKSKKLPAAYENDFEKIYSRAYHHWLSHKRLRGIPDNGFDHAGFFQMYHEHLAAALKEDQEITPKTTVSLAFEALEYAFPSRHGKKRRWTFKGPLSGVSTKKLDWFRENFSGTIVFIHRNPHARLYSQMLHFRKKGRPQYAPRLRESITGFLRLCARNVREQREAKKIAQSPDVISIEYEELVTDCEKTMKNLCKKLGIVFNEIVVRPTKLGVSVKNPTDRTGGSGAVSIASVYKYRQELTFLEKILFSIALKYSSSF